MRAAVRRACLVAFRCPALAESACLVTGLMTAFVVVWRAGLPILGTLDVYHQSVAVHRGLLLVTLPWVAHRSQPHESPRATAWLGVLTATDPGTHLLARVLATWLVLVVQIVTALPALYLAQQASDVSWTAPVIDLATPIAWAAGIAAVSVASCRWLRHSIPAWTVTAAWTCVAGVLAYLASVPAALSSVAAVATAAVGALMLTASSTRWAAWS
jgi:hypothetical protein